MKLRKTLIYILLFVGMAISAYILLPNTGENEWVYQEDIALLNQLRELDSEISILSMRARYGFVFNYDYLAGKTNQLLLSFRALDNTRIKEYAKEDPALKEALAEYEDRVMARLDAVESFKSHNSVLRNSIKYAPRAGDSLIDQLAENPRNSDSVDLLKAINTSLYRWTLYSDSKDKFFIRDNAASILNLKSLFRNDRQLMEYYDHLMTVINEQELTRKYLDNVLGINSKFSLLRVQNLYTDKYLADIDEASTVRYGILGLYALLAIGMVIYLATQLRKQYVNLEQLVAERSYALHKTMNQLRLSQTEQIQTHKMTTLAELAATVGLEIKQPLSDVTANLDALKNLLGRFSSIFASLSAAYQEAIKPDRNKRVINSQVAHAVKTCRKMEVDGTVKSIRRLLADSTASLDDIGSFVEDLTYFGESDTGDVRDINVWPGSEHDPIWDTGDVRDINVRESVLAALKLLTSQIEDAGIHIKTGFRGTVIVSINPVQFNHVITSLLDYGIQASPKSGILTIKVYSDRNKACIEITDMGEGLTADQKLQFFDPARIGNDGKRTSIRKAIALPRSYKIIRSHGGNIEIDSSEGRGTTLRVTLPLKYDEVNK